MTERCRELRLDENDKNFVWLIETEYCLEENGARVGAGKLVTAMLFTPKQLAGLAELAERLTGDYGGGVK